MNRLKLRILSAVLVFTFVLGVDLAYAQITPSADAYTNTVDPTTNYGAKILLDVDAATQTTYIQFNLGSIPATYTSADITKATLKLYVNTVSTAGSFNVDYVNGTWAESTITSSLAPALGTTIAASVPITTADKNQFILIDVTAAVQAWLSGTSNDGIALVANGTFNATFDSKESTSTSHAPELDVVFAGGGTLTGVTTASGSGLTGGGTSGTLNLGLLTTCASGQVLEWNGSAWACATASGAGTITGVTTSTTSGLSGGGTSGTLALQVNPAVVPLLAAANSFTGNQTVNGNLSATGTVSGGSFQIGSNLFAYGSYANGNALLGFAGNSTMAGTYNTAVGYQALFSNTGNENTASGFQALFANTTGNGNTAYGWSALYANTASVGNTAVGQGALENNAGTAAEGGGNTAVGDLALRNNTTGGANTAIGYYAGQTADSSSVTGSKDTLLGTSAALSTGTWSNATAIGANAEVAANNALVLGSIAGTNGATNSTSVGIGTTAPAYTLDVHGTGNFTGAVNFTGPVTFSSTDTSTGEVQGAVVNATTGFDIGGVSFATGSAANGTVSLGFSAGQAGTDNTASGTGALKNNTGPYNTANGYQALFSDTSGGYNTAVGYQALYANTTTSGNVAVGFAAAQNNAANYNTAVGDSALINNTTGTNNTALGISAGPSAGNFTNTTAIGSNAVVSESNAVVLGCVANQNSCPATPINVGIGTPTPAYTLDVHGTGNFTAASGNALSATSSNASGEAIYALNSATTGTNFGVFAVGTSPNSTGVAGTGGYFGVEGDTSSTAAGAAGVVGQANANGQTEGVYGLNLSTASGAVGVAGTASGLSGQTIGVYGVNSSTTDGAAAVLGTALGNSGNTLGVYGKTISSTGIGVYGVGVSPSAIGSVIDRYPTAVGVWGDTSQTTLGGDAAAGVGVAGTADNAAAGYFVNNSNQTPTLIIGNSGSGGTGGVVTQSARLLEAYGESTGKGCTMDVSGTLNCEGTVTAIVPTNSGASKVSLYAVQSPENWFEDFGSGTLSNGAATIALDPTFTQTVNTGTEYHVFLTPNGDSNGLYVSQKTATSFEVREQGGGRSSIAFDYRIVAKRSGYENVRLTDVTEQYQKMAEQRELRRGRTGQRPVRPSAAPLAIPVRQIPLLRAAAQPKTTQHE